MCTFARNVLVAAYGDLVKLGGRHGSWSSCAFRGPRSRDDDEHQQRHSKERKPCGHRPFPRVSNPWPNFVGCSD